MHMEATNIITIAIKTWLSSSVARGHKYHGTGQQLVQDISSVARTPCAVALDKNYGSRQCFFDSAQRFSSVALHELWLRTAAPWFQAIVLWLQTTVLRLWTTAPWFWTAFLWRLTTVLQFCSSRRQFCRSL